MSCEQCTQGGILDGEPTGVMEESRYLAHPPSTNSTGAGGSKKCIVYLTDIFGLPLKNCKLIADDLAKRTGLDVYIPDIFNGEPPFKVDQLVDLMPQKPGEKMGIIKILKAIWLAIRRLPYLIRNRESVVDKRIHECLTQLRKDKGYERIGVVGYCFGGAMAVRLGSTSLVNTAVVCHPGTVSMKQIKAIQVPTAFVCAEDDMAFPMKFANECEVALKEKSAAGGPKFEFKEYKGVVHGFACRPLLTIPAHKEGFEGALNQAVEWFNKTL